MWTHAGTIVPVVPHVLVSIRGSDGCHVGDNYFSRDYVYIYLAFLLLDSFPLLILIEEEIKPGRFSDDNVIHRSCDLMKSREVLDDILNSMDLLKKFIG